MLGFASSTPSKTKITTTSYLSTHPYLPEVVNLHSTGSTAADEVQTTQFEYQFQGSGAAIKSVKTLVERERQAENGPSSAELVASAVVFDVVGRVKWSVSVDGVVTEYEYDHPSGQPTKVTVNKSFATLPDDIDDLAMSVTGNALGSFEYTTVYDLLGRIRMTQGPAANGSTASTVKSMWAYEMRPRHIDELTSSGHGYKFSSVRYMRYIKFPILTENEEQPWAGPASSTWVDAQEGAVMVCEYAPFGDPPEEGLPTNAISVEDHDKAIAYIDNAVGTSATILSKRTKNISLSGLVTEARAWHDVDGDLGRGTSTAERSYAEAFEYDAFGRRIRHTSSRGTVQSDEYDVLGRIQRRKYGTEASGLVTVTEFVYDDPTFSGSSGVGNGNLSSSRSTVDGNIRERRFVYDARDRLVRVFNPLPPHAQLSYDNLDRVTESWQYPQAPSTATASWPTAPSRHSKTLFGQRGLSYKSAISIDPAASSETFLETHIWRDRAGRLVATLAPDSPASKVVYDAFGRVSASYVTNRGGDVGPGQSGTLADATSLTNDIVLEQTHYEYDTIVGNLRATKAIVRRHDAYTQTGALTSSGSDPTGIAMYSSNIYDAANRLSMRIEYGTNKPVNLGSEIGDTFCNAAPPSQWPLTESDVGTYASQAIVSKYNYGARGLVESTVDPLGRVTRYLFDDLGRTIATIENYIEDANSSEPVDIDWTGDNWYVSNIILTSEQNRVTTSAEYLASDGWIVRQTAVNVVSGTPQNNLTDYVYGVSAGTYSALASNDWLREVRYAKRDASAPSTEDNTVEYTYNEMGELASVTDQRGVKHTYTRDQLGRVIRDHATWTNPSGLPPIDSRVVAIDAEYDDNGRLSDVRSLSSVSGPTVVDHVRYSYDALWRLSQIEQDPDSDLSVTSGHAPRTVGYTYDTAPIAPTQTGYAIGNRSRLTSQTYPYAFASIGPPAAPTTHLTYTYGAPGASDETLNKTIGRVTNIGLDEVAGSTTDSSEIAEYQFVGLGMISHVDLPLVNIQLDRTVDAKGQRRYASTTSQALATYPGWDRFGRVKRQAWVAANYNMNSTTGTPNRREHVNLLYTYDRIGNPIFKQNAQQAAGYAGRWADRDVEYNYDKLDRLTLARRGVLSAGATGIGGGGTAVDLDPNTPTSGRPRVGSQVETSGAGLAWGSQKWELHSLGNWSKFSIDLTTDNTSSSPPNAWLDMSSSGFDAFEEQSRAHNGINELESIAAPSTAPVVPAGATFAAAPLITPLSYQRDDGGNTYEIIKTGAIGTGSKHQLIYDAWNRLVQIDKWMAPSGGTAGYQVLARYDYNGLHWRTRKLAYTTPDGPGGATAQERVYTYNAAWQAISEEIDDDRDTTTGSPSPQTIDRVVQQVFGLKGVNDALYRRADNRVYIPAEEILDNEGYGTGEFTEPSWEPLDGEFDNSFYQLADAQGSIVSVVTAELCTFSGPTQNSGTLAGGRTVDQLEYDPYGRSKLTGRSDFDHNGVVNISLDFSSGSSSAWFAGSMAGDQDEDGALTLADVFAYLNDYFASDYLGVTQDAPSTPWVDNPYLYCGYYADVETLGISGPNMGFLYHVRHRVYDPASGRWLTRDPAGFVDGVNLYAYVGARVLRGFDPMGLDWIDNTINFVTGVADVASLGTSVVARHALGLQDGVDTSSDSYKSGVATGVAVAVGVATGGAATAAMGAGASATLGGMVTAGAAGGLAGDAAAQATEYIQGRRGSYDPIRGAVAAATGGFLGGTAHYASKFINAMVHGRNAPELLLRGSGGGGAVGSVEGKGAGSKWQPGDDIYAPTIRGTPK